MTNFPPKGGGHIGAAFRADLVLIGAVLDMMIQKGVVSREFVLTYLDKLAAAAQQQNDPIEAAAIKRAIDGVLAVLDGAVTSASAPPLFDRFLKGDKT